MKNSRQVTSYRNAGNFLNKISMSLQTNIYKKKNRREKWAKDMNRQPTKATQMINNV